MSSRKGAGEKVIKEGARVKRSSRKGQSEEIKEESRVMRPSRKGAG